MMMKRKDVVQFTGLCYTTVYNLEKRGLFPPRRQLSPGRVAWVRAEVIAWLSNREIEKSLKRARRSEAALKVERDALEITVEARTRQLREAQADQLSQLYRFAEFGQISSGLFHDLVNPLNAMSLNMENILSIQDHATVSEMRERIERAMGSAKRMEKIS